jgi:cobalt transporter subunit CbtA
MLRNLILAAAGAGLAACIAMAGVQFVTTEPLILHAEVFEQADAAATPAAHVHDEGAWEPADGWERTLYTLAADFLIAVSVSLMLLAAMVLKGDPIDGKRGLLWGAAGFVAVSLLPALGLPPELPGTPTADLLSRQAWWLGTAAASAIAIFLLVFGRSWWVRALAFVLVVAPHVIGAPAPPSDVASYPAGMAGEFVIASVVVSAVLWSLAGLVSGWLHQRLSTA